MEKQKPNLFTYATSELSQDAFICWLVEFANPEYGAVNPIMRERATAFINLIMEHWNNSRISRIKKLETHKQYKNIDVFIRIECAKEGIVNIVIEDKIHTSEHSEQIKRYRDLIADTTKGSDQIIIPVLLKTGNMVSYDRGGKDRVVVNRRDMIEIMRPGREAGIKSDIYLDFLEHLEIWENEFQAYAKLPINSWNGSQWCGFFETIHGRISQVNSWEYVNNPTGGFWGLNWEWREVEDSFSADAVRLYLQLEEEELCFKAMLGNSEAREKRKWPYHTAIIDAARASGNASIVKRPRFTARGEYTTLAYWLEYRVVRDSDNLIDLEATVQNLKQAEAILAMATNVIKSSSTLQG